MPYQQEQAGTPIAGQRLNHETDLDHLPPDQIQATASTLNAGTIQNTAIKQTSAKNHATFDRKTLWAVGNCD